MASRIACPERAARYADEHLPVEIAASGGFVDEVVEPDDTRDRVAEALERAR